MAGNGIWAKIHKWLALLMAIQILIWFASGLFFALAPLERVRSEHRIAAQHGPPVALDAAAAGLRRLAAAGVAPGERVEVRTLLGRPVALVAPGEGRPRLYDLATARPLSPIPMTFAARIAEADHAKATCAPVAWSRITANDSEYRGALPAWRVDFDDGANRSIYVAADSGAVTARRSTLWRVYDFLWGLHIMDWRGHEDFNTSLLVGRIRCWRWSMSIAGIVLLPGRLGFTAWLQAAAG